MTPLTGIVTFITVRPYDPSSVLLELDTHPTTIYLYTEDHISCDGRLMTGYDVAQWLMTRPVQAILHPDPQRYGAVTKAEFTTIKE